MAVPVLDDANQWHRCSGVRTWVGLDTNSPAQLVRDTAAAGSSLSVHVDEYKSVGICDNCEQKMLLRCINCHGSYVQPSWYYGWNQRMSARICFVLIH